MRGFLDCVAWDINTPEEGSQIALRWLNTPEEGSQAETWAASLIALRWINTPKKGSQIE